MQLLLIYNPFEQCHKQDFEICDFIYSSISPDAASHISECLKIMSYYPHCLHQVESIGVLRYTGLYAVGEQQFAAADFRLKAKILNLIRRAFRKRAERKVMSGNDSGNGEIYQFSD